MAVSIELNGNEQSIRDQLVDLVHQVRESISNHEQWGEKQINRYSTMAKLAHQLHMSLSARGIEPKHHKYMLENRGVPVEDIEFYNHIHPVEDLIRFIDDPDANNDPEDCTIGEEFSFRIYTRRWGHFDSHSITRTSSGWLFKGAQSTSSGKCNKNGDPSLYMTLDHDSVCYPANIRIFFERIWDKASDGLSKEDVQQAITDVANWINTCEKSVPRGIFEDLI